MESAPVKHITPVKAEEAASLLESGEVQQSVKNGSLQVMRIKHATGTSILIESSAGEYIRLD